MRTPPSQVLGTTTETSVLSPLPWRKGVCAVHFRAPAALRNEGWDEKLAFASFLIRVLGRPRRQLQGLPAARAQTTPVPRLCRPWKLWSPWLSARQHVRVSGGKVGGEFRHSMPPAPCQHVEGGTYPWRDATCPESGHLLAQLHMKNEGSYHRLSLLASPDTSQG